MSSKTGTDARIRRNRPTAARHRPVVGVICDLKTVPPHRMHAVGEKYLQALAEFSQAVPLLFPVLETPLETGALLDAVDGIFLPGSPSNVEPAHYGGEHPEEGTLLDPRRDATSLDLIRAAIARDKPLLAVCRGFQELNVALGGTLHQQLHEADSEPGFAPRMDHREDKSAPLDVQYGPAHDIACVEAGVLAGLMGTAALTVNSLHGQGVARKAGRLRIEARAPDGTIEAAAVEGTAFVLGVQWHPEWRPESAPHNASILAAFGASMASSVGAAPG